MEDFVDSQLYKRTTWLNKNIDFSFGSSITEYDMKSAGLSLIKEFKMLPDDEIQKLEALNKHIWTDPNKKLYGDCNAPEKVINVIIYSRKNNIY